MPRAHANEIDYGYEERSVHAEPMHARLGDKLGNVEQLRGWIEDDAQSETRDRARARFFRSLRALEETFKRALDDVGAALRGTGSCAMAWARLEARVLTSGQQEKRLDHSTSH